MPKKDDSKGTKKKSAGKDKPKSGKPRSSARKHTKKHT